MSYNPEFIEEIVTNNDGYDYDINHSLNDDILANSLHAFEGTAAKFAADFIQDATVRVNYMKGIKRMSETILSEVKSGAITVQKGAQLANELRNSIMEEMRVLSTPQARTYASLQKVTGLKLEEILERKAQEIFKKSFSVLTEQEKTRIYYKAIESAGKSDIRTNAISKRLRIAGKVCLVVTAAIASYTILTSDNKTKAILQQSTIIAGGLAGGKAGAAVITPYSYFCGYAAPFCIAGGALIGALLGACLANEVTEYFDDEIEEFLRWEIF
jgi:hypothetical protein